MHSGDDEIRLLQTLCQASDAALVHRACLALRGHSWSSGEHRVVYEACSELAACGARIAPLALAARLTRAGFPDVALDALFAPLQNPDLQLSVLLDAITAEGRRP